MQTGLYVSLSSQLALDRRLTTLADNVANSTTVGFRATEVKFNQVVSDQKTAEYVDLSCATTAASFSDSAEINLVVFR